MNGKGKLVAAFLVACAFAVGCGSSSKDAVVIHVGGSSITRATVEHWIHLEAVASFDPLPTGPPPKGLIPDPPSYAACIPFRQRKYKYKVPRATLKHECEARYQSVKREVLEILISYHWVTDEARRLGVTVSEAEVASFLQRRFPTNGELQHFLEVTGASLADEHLYVRRLLLSDKLQELAARSARTPAARLHVPLAFATGLLAKWSPSTSCHPGYVVRGCRQFSVGAQ